MVQFIDLYYIIACCDSWNEGLFNIFIIYIVTKPNIFRYQENIISPPLLSLSLSLSISILTSVSLHKYQHRILDSIIPIHKDQNATRCGHNHRQIDVYGHNSHRRYSLLQQSQYNHTVFNSSIYMKVITLILSYYLIHCVIDIST